MGSEIGGRVGDYEVLSLLGAGGMGQVYSVRNVISGRVEAMKVLPPDFAADTGSALRFTAEIRILANLDHPNIAQLRTAFQAENRLVMVMELVEGSTLERKMGERPLSLNDACDYASQLLSALSYAHSKGVIHRDIKPANIMITQQGIVKLMDFGIAKSVQDPLHTQPGTTLGSVYYMSPEQVRGAGVDARSDIYSLGVTLYQMLTGRRPFNADTAYSILNAQLNEVPASPGQFNANIPFGLSQIVLQAMAKVPDQRFQTAEAFRAALASIQSPCTDATATMPFGAVTATMPGVAAPLAAPPDFGSAPPAPFPPSLPQVAVRDRHRSLWLGLGAVAAIVAMIAAATLLPHIFATHASQKPASVETESAPPSPSTQKADATASPLADNGGSPPTPQHPEAIPTQPSPVAPIGMGSKSAKVSKAPVANPSVPSQAQIAPSPPVEPAAPGPSRQEINAARNRVIQLTSRADAANAAVESIRHQQQADGLDLRGDILSSMSRMNSYLTEANAALNQSDLQAANDNMERAEKELSTLEKFLGR